MTGRFKPAKSHVEARCRGKVVYPSGRIAGIRADQLTAVRGVKLYAYHCPVCKKWHHTSKPQTVADDFEVLV